MSPQDHPQPMKGPTTMAITRWRDEYDGTWHESGDLDQYDVEQDAARLQNEATHLPTMDGLTQLRAQRAVILDRIDRQADAGEDTTTAEQEYTDLDRWAIRHWTKPT